MPILFIFRRDYGLDNNFALHSALKLAKQNQDTVIPAFLFNTYQIESSLLKGCLL
jgi:hypothetical protein